MQSFELKFRYTERDFKEFLWNYAVRGRGRRMLWWVVIAIAVLAFTLQMQGRMNPAMAVSMIGIYGLFALLWRWMLMQSGKRTYNLNPQLQEDRTCSVSDAELNMKGETFALEYTWDQFLKFAETPNLFLLYTSRASALILPKRAFTEEQTAEFRQFMVEK